MIESLLLPLMKFNPPKVASVLKTSFIDFPEFVEAIEYRAVPVGADVEVREALREALFIVHFK